MRNKGAKQVDQWTGGRSRLGAVAVLVSMCVSYTACGRSGGPSQLVSAEWLAARLADPAVVVLHVARDRAGFEQGHIPGARFLPLSAVVTERDGLPNELPEIAYLDSVFESVGVSDDVQVVLYGDLGGLAAARTFLTLDVLGHGEHTALLDGGLEVWKAEGLPLSTAEAAVSPGSLTIRPRPEILVSANWLAEHLEDPNVSIIDARPGPEYAGKVAGAGLRRAGHIPGAASLHWQGALLSDARPVLKDRATLRAMYEGAGARPGELVVLYCRTGLQASHGYFVARLLGYETRLYDASYIEWSGRDSLPVAP